MDNLKTYYYFLKSVSVLSAPMRSGFVFITGARHSTLWGIFIALSKDHLFNSSVNVLSFVQNGGASDQGVLFKIAFFFSFRASGPNTFEKQELSIWMVSYMLPYT